MIPVARFRTTKLISEHPGEWIAAMQAAAVCWFLFKIASHSRRDPNAKGADGDGHLVRDLHVNQPDAGWCVAVGTRFCDGRAARGDLLHGVKRRPLLAGIFFALAFGNRTENLLTAPIFMYFRPHSEAGQETEAASSRSPYSRRGFREIR